MKDAELLTLKNNLWVAGDRLEMYLTHFRISPSNQEIEAIRKVETEIGRLVQSIPFESLPLFTGHKNSNVSSLVNERLKTGS